MKNKICACLKRKSKKTALNDHEVDDEWDGDLDNEVNHGI